MDVGSRFDVDLCFSPDYAAARSRFLAAAQDRDAAIETIRHPDRGPAGETLAIDLAWFGPRDADRVLLLLSATHGVEGFCGSGAQLDWMASGGPARLPSRTAVLLVHALNPHGFAWLRRVNEDGVDLNRNGWDPEAAPAPNPGYDELADAFVPPDLRPATLARADDAIRRYREAHGAAALASARSAGQRAHPDGIFYGGLSPVWSMRQVASIAAAYDLPRRQAVAVIDHHTGLGPHGHGEPIVGHRPGESGQRRCREWYGDSLGEPLLGRSAAIPVVGLGQEAWARAIGGDRLTFVALEFGTYPPEHGDRALRDDHVLHRRGPPDWSDPECIRIKRDLRKFYHPDVRPWKQLVLFRSRQIVGQALDGLAGNPAGEFSHGIATPEAPR